MPYDVYLISNDASSVETMKDIILALDSLSAAFDDAFNRLENKIRTEKLSLTNINLRISACQTKLKAVNGSKIPTLIRSTATFPGSKMYPLYTPVSTNDKLTHKRTSNKNTASTRYFPADPKKSSVGNNDLTVELQSLLCRLHEGSDTLTEKVLAIPLSSTSVYASLPTYSPILLLTTPTCCFD